MKSSASGLTLVEVLVVLFLLALLAQTAVLATEGVLEQGQRDATERSLTAFEEAVLGARNAIDGSGRPLVRGFVADLGRLPVRSADTEVGLFLKELWQQPVGVDAFAYKPPSGDRNLVPEAGDGVYEVMVGCGWRGDYLRLGIGRTEFRDGWGRAFRCGSIDGSSPAAGAPIAVVESLGANGEVGGDGYDQDLRVITEQTVSPIVPARWQGTVPVFIQTASGGDFVIRVYGPSGSNAVTLKQVPASLPAGGQTIPVVGVPIGPRVLRVYKAEVPATAETEFPDNTQRSVATPVVVEPSGNPTITVVMP